MRERTYRTNSTPNRRHNSAPVPTSAALTKHDRAKLIACEATIAEGLGQWVNVSNALAEIAASKLYRETHRTFEDYCRGRWDVRRSQGHPLVLSARVAMSPVGDRIHNERQARELTRLLDDEALLVAVGVGRRRSRTAGR